MNTYIYIPFVFQIRYDKTFEISSFHYYSAFMKIVDCMNIDRLFVQLTKSVTISQTSKNE